jgi:hypothetical protein
MVWPHFGLKSVLRWTLVGIVLVATGLAWWRWWANTKHTRALSDAVSQSVLDTRTKSVLMALCGLPAAWESGLIRRLVGSASMQIVWSGQTHGSHEGVESVYIFDEFVRPIAVGSIPPVCVVMDRNRGLVAWGDVAPFSSGFLSANLDAENTLTITTFANWFYGKGVYRYAIRDRSIVALDDGTFDGFENNELPEYPKMRPPDPALEDFWGTLTPEDY